LAVAQGIIKNHGGAISFKSQVGQGTTFEVLLPLLQTKTPPEKTTAATSIPTGNEHILVVDDEPAIVEVVSDLLQSLGYQVTVCTESPMALDIFRANPDDFDLLVSDQTMPGLTGLELAREITAIKPALPVILCTGFSRDIDADTAKRLGIKGFIMKPLAFGELARLVRSLLD
jgi:CheY-like chemotaxis protein